MAEEDTPQEEKTEEPTARRLEKAKEEGQVLRSQDMTIAAVTISVIATLYLAGFWMGPRFQELFARALTLRSELVFDKGMMFGWLASITLDGFLTLVPNLANFLGHIHRLTDSLFRLSLPQRRILFIIHLIDFLDFTGNVLRLLIFRTTV